MIDSPNLFLFTHGATTYAYTNADRDMTYSNVEYKAIAIGRNAFEVGDDVMRADMTVSVQRDCDLAIANFLNLIDKVTTLTVFELNGDATAAVFWKGRVSSFKPSGDEVEFLCESVFTSLRRPGLRRKYQRSCTHVLYGEQCGVNKDAFGVAGNVILINGQVVRIDSASSKPNGYFQGGMLKMPDGSFKFIQAHTGQDCALLHAAPTLVAALAAGPVAVTLYPGCDRSRATCISVFNNSLRMGGFPWLPERNPFDGDAIV